jgi:hypothetical protein
MTTTENTATTLEIETCSRCGGSGSFSYCQSHGTKCFKCGGKGRTLSKRGEAASVYLTAMRSKRADQIVTGDEIHIRGFDGWQKVISVEPTDTAGWYSIDGGVRREARKDLLTFSTSGLGLAGVAPEKIRVKQTAEQSAQTFAAALAYQATLTKAGKPRAR